MATKDEILNAVQIVDEFAGRPSVGFVREVLDDLTKSTEDVTVVPVEETPVTSTKKTSNTSDSTVDAGSDLGTA